MKKRKQSKKVRKQNIVCICSLMVEQRAFNPFSESSSLFRCT